MRSKLASKAGRILQFVSVCLLFLFQTHYALADNYEAKVGEVRAVVNEVGARACKGQGSAVSRLFYYSEGKDRAFSAQAYLNLAYLYSPKEPCVKAGYRHDFHKWRNFVEEAAKRDWPVATTYYGEILMRGLHGVQKDPNRAQKMLHKAVSAGSSSAAAVFARGYYEGLLLGGKDIAKAQKYLEIGYARNPTKRILKLLDKYKALLAKANSTSAEKSSSESGPSLEETIQFLELAIIPELRAFTNATTTLILDENQIRVVDGKKTVRSIDLRDVDYIETRLRDEAKHGLFLHCRNQIKCARFGAIIGDRDKLVITFRRKDHNRKTAMRAAKALVHYAKFFDINIEVRDRDKLGSAFD